MQTKRRLEGSGSAQRMSDLRSQFQAASKGGKKAPKPLGPADGAESEEDARKRRRPAVQDQRQQWLDRRVKDDKKARRGRRRGETPVRKSGGGFLFFLLVAIGGGGGFGLYAAEWGSVSLAARHLAAVPGCDAVRFVGLAPAARGEAGYWTHHDPQNLGVSCGSARGA